jgi:hypothetical protein
MDHWEEALATSRSKMSSTVMRVPAMTNFPIIAFVLDITYCPSRWFTPL